MLLTSVHKLPDNIPVKYSFFLMFYLIAAYLCVVRTELLSKN